MPIPRPLSSKEQKAVDEYFIDYIQVGAYIRAGYAAKYAQKNATTFFGQDKIIEAVEKRRAELSRRTGISAERVLKELARLGFADMRDYTETGPDGVRLKPSKDWTDDQAAAVAEVYETTSKDGGSIRLKLHEKGTALVSLAKHLGLIKDRVQHEIEGWDKFLALTDPENQGKRKPQE